MPQCTLDGCGISCEFGCTCMSTLGGCECGCQNQTLPAFTWLKGVDRADPDLIVNFTATEMPLVRVAEWFDLIFPDQIAIPASRAHARITTDQIIRQVTLGDLIEQIGLIPLKKPLVGRLLREIKPVSDD